MAYYDEKDRGGTGKAASPAKSRAVAPPNRAASQRGTGKLKGNSGDFIGLEEHGDTVYARYQARKDTWISASLADRGYDKKFGPDTAFGAYLGIAVDSNLEPIKNPDRIEPGLEYLIPVGKVAKSPSPPAQPPPPPVPVPKQNPVPPAYATIPPTNQKAEPFSQIGPITAGKRVYAYMLTQNYPSFELDSDPPPPDREPRAAVTYWLQRHRKEIIEAETRFHVSRVAIAGAIAWEALENPQGGSLKAVGVGKIHLVAAPGDISWPEAVENAGKMPKLTLEQRKEFLKNPRISILYIGAIMDIVSEEGERNGWHLRNSDGVLGHVFHSRGPKKWAAEIAKKPHNTEFSLQPGGMGAWIEDNRNYLWSAAGVAPLQ